MKTGFSKVNYFKNRNKKKEEEMRPTTTLEERESKVKASVDIVHFFLFLLLGINLCLYTMEIRDSC